ncbi:MAG: hypothetical protein IKN30_01690 [Synergistaceae bacterium]|nr:hypothetical protein [Synergistaceae bacterium]
MRQRHKFPEGTDNDFDIRDLTQNLENASAMATTMSLLLGAIASISLVIGGIGIIGLSANSD